MSGRSGDLGERLAAEFLTGQHYRIIARNWHAGRSGEIDLVALDEGVLVFVEVKTVSRGGFGDPLSWVTARKQRQLARLADAFLYSYEGPVRAVRFDVVTVDLRAIPPNLKHLTDAFRLM